MNQAYPFRNTRSASANLKFNQLRLQKSASEAFFTLPYRKMSIHINRQLQLRMNIHPNSRARSIPCRTNTRSIPYRTNAIHNVREKRAYLVRCHPASTFAISERKLP